MTSLKVSFYETFEEEESVLKKLLPKSIKAYYFKETVQDALDLSRPTDVFSIRTKSTIPKSCLEKISGVLSRTTGKDNLQDYEDVSLGFLPIYCTRAVAEQAMLLWTSLLRKLPNQIDQFQEYNRSRLTGRENKKRRISVLGVGNIGYEICKIAKGLEMEVIGVDLNEKHPDINYSNIEDATKESEIIVCSMDLNKSSKGILNYNLLQNCDYAPVFINISRGEISPVRDLANLLDEGILGGVALDVIENEKNIEKQIKEDFEFYRFSKMKNVILTPHNAFNTEEALERKTIETIKQLEYFIDNRKFIQEVSI